MRIRVKGDLCCGAQMCVLSAPDLFRIDDLGYNDSDGDEVPAGQEDAARAAANSCPESAIDFADD